MKFTLKGDSGSAYTVRTPKTARFKIVTVHAGKEDANEIIVTTTSASPALYHDWIKKIIGHSVMCD